VKSNTLQRLACKIMLIVCTSFIVLLANAFSDPQAHAAIGDNSGANTVGSTATVVVAKSNASDKIKVIGTSTITVMDGATVDEVKARIMAKDQSSQAHVVLDVSNNVKGSGAILNGDKLFVTSENGKHNYTYKFAIYDPDKKERDGVYWNEDLYNQIDQTVNENTPVFKGEYYDITDAKYASLVRKVTETFYIGNAANNPSNKTSPLVSSSQEVWYYTDAITAAIKEANENGGGIVVIPANGSLNANGAYYSGAITLLSNVNLHIEEGATVKFMRNKSNEYYPVVLTSYEGTDYYNFSPLIYALNQTNIAITGGGLLDGQEDMWNWRPWKKGYWGELSVENKDTASGYGTNGVLNAMNFEDVPITKRIFTDDGHMPETIPVIDGDSVKYVAPPEDAVALKSTFRPSFISPYKSTNILIEGVKIRNTPFWIIHPVSSDNIIIRDLDIYSDKTKDFESGGWNNDDGLDPESSRYVVMERNHMTVSDDGGAIKAGRNVNGRKHRNPSENIIIRDSIYNNDGGGSAAVSMGSEMSGSIRNVFVHDSEFGGVGLSLILKIKTNSNRGGVVENIYLRDLLLHKAISAMVQFDSNFSETVPFPNADIYNPTIRNIYLDNVNTAPTMTAGRTTFQFSSAASRSPVENVYYRNSVFYTTNTMQAAFNSNKNIKNFVVENVKYINPNTKAETIYNTTPLQLLNETKAIGSGINVPLTAVSIDHPHVINKVSSNTFQLSGKVDLSLYPNFVTGGTVRIFVDRSTTPIGATLNPDGSFVSNHITLNDNQSWYIDRHYVTVNFYNGLNMNSMVYQMVVDESVGAVLSGADRVGAGASFDLTYGLANVKGSVYAQDMTFTYDPEKVEFVSAQSMKDGFVVLDKKVTADKVRIIAVNLDGDLSANAGGDLLKLRWNSKALTETSETTITLSNLAIANAEGEETQVDGAAHHVSIIFTDKALLHALIAEAQQAHDAAVEGPSVGQYPAGSKATLLAAINNAQAVAGNSVATEQQVEAALTDLSRSLQAFRSSIIAGIPGDFNGDEKISVGDLAIVAKYYGKTSEDPDWNQYKSADLNNDGVIDIADLVIVARKILEL
jgi:polygalacturonase